MNVGENIKKFRKQKGFTQKDLAEKIGVSVQAISKWECGSTPDISQILPLADALDTSANELLGYIDTYDKLCKGWYKVLREHGEGSLEIIEYEREALREYPNDETFLYRLAGDLRIRGEMAEDKTERINYLTMAEKQYLENLKKYPDFEANRHGLVEVYMQLGRREDALSCALDSKDGDILLKQIYKGEELRHHRQKLMDKYFRALIGEALPIKDVAVLRIIKNMIYAAFPDGNYQRYSRFLNMLDFRIADQCEKAGDLEGAVEAFRDAVRRSREENKKSDKFTTPLFDSLPTDREFNGEGKNQTVIMIDKNMSSAEWLYKVMTGEYWELAKETELSRREDYKNLIKELEEILNK